MDNQNASVYREWTVDEKLAYCVRHGIISWGRYFEEIREVPAEKRIDWDKHNAALKAATKGTAA